ncbi:MAG: peptidase M28 family protein, partial [Ignavibacteria bacterium]|nr:peptidase M28 family protein [Ignavibacteria bacterium]
MLLRKSFVLLIFIFFYSHSNPQTFDFAKHSEVADRILKSALREQAGYELLRELCAIGPRLSGSENSIKAIHWAVKKMNYLGFDSVWLQPVMVPKWVRGNFESAVITHSKFFKG